MYKTLLKSVVAPLFTAVVSSSVIAETPTEPGSSNNPHPCLSRNCAIGPDPSNADIMGNGAYAVGTIRVSSAVSGFGGGTIHYPRNIQGELAAIAVVPGFMSFEDSIVWWGERLASHGFVVITIDTNSPLDNPDSRANQLSAALDYVVAQSGSAFSAINGLVDADRLGAIGWSMGGGGALRLSTDRVLRAIIPQAPWYAGSHNFDEVTTPTFIIACENDAIAPVNSHASPFYNAIPDTTSKLFVEINNAGHFCGNTGQGNEALLGSIGVSWMKAYMDLDDRYQPFLCSGYDARFDVSESRESCIF